MKFFTRAGLTRHSDGLDDADARAVQLASRAVGIQLAVAAAVLVLVVLIAEFVFVFRRITPQQLFDLSHRHETTIDVGGIDILIAGISIGFVAIIVAGSLSIFATRRAVRPLGDALRIQRTFVADASHELRTPLAVLDARLQLLQRSLATEDRSTPIVAELRHDTKTLIDIVNDLLAAAEIGGQNYTDPVEVNPIVMLAVNSMRVMAIDKNVTIETEISPPVWTMIPSASIHRCVIALLDNALDFAPPSSTITVTVSEHRGTVRLAVRDEGGGIVGIDPARIFDRFARSTVATDDSAKGSAGAEPARASFGIGLALVRDTVERVGGLVSVSQTSGAGTEIELLIPAASGPRAPLH